MQVIRVQVWYDYYLHFLNSYFGYYNSFDYYLSPDDNYLLHFHWSDYFRKRKESNAEKRERGRETQKYKT